MECSVDANPFRITVWWIIAVVGILEPVASESQPVPERVGAESRMASLVHGGQERLYLPLPGLCLADRLSPRGSPLYLLRFSLSSALPGVSGTLFQRLTSSLIHSLSVGIELTRRFRRVFPDHQAVCFSGVSCFYVVQPQLSCVY